MIEPTNAEGPRGTYGCACVSDSARMCTEVAIHEGEPTHWMPLPAPPAIDAALAASEQKGGA